MVLFVFVFNHKMFILMDQSADETITRDELDQLQGEVSWLLFHVGAINLAFPRVLFVIYSTTREVFYTEIREW